VGVGPEAEPPPPGSELQRRRWYVLAVVSIGMFMTPFDASIVAVALPAMGADLHLSYSYALWAQAAYLLVTSALLIPAGRIADSRGPVRWALSGTVVFAAGSILAGLAPNGLAMIVGRCIQGAGGAFMFSTATGVITAVFPPGERGRAIGLNLTAGYAGMMIAPVVGGLIVSHLDWRWIFFINVPIAAATLVAGWSLIGAERRDRSARAARQARQATASLAASGSKRVDWPGTLMLGGLLSCLFVPLTFSPLWGWGSARTLVFLGVAAVLLVTFVLWEDRVHDPLLDLDLLRKNRVFAATCSAAFINSMGVFAVITLTAVFAQVVQGHSGQRAGAMLLVQPAFMIMLSPVCGRLSDRVGSRPLTLAGPLAIAAGMAQLAFAGQSTGRVLAGLACAGIGMALFSSPNMSAIMGSVGRSQLSVASGFQSMMRFGGQGFSIAVLGSIAAWQLGSQGARVIFLGATASQASAAAYNQGYRLAMLVGAGLTVAASLLSWFARPTISGTR
jgi:EmrB/QacA subfamily drug resistance transporter